jgi:hypothetical protein
LMKRALDVSRHRASKNSRGVTLQSRMIFRIKEGSKSRPSCLGMMVVRPSGAR